MIGRSRANLVPAFLAACLWPVLAHGTEPARQPVLLPPIKIVPPTETLPPPRKADPPVTAGTPGPLKSPGLGVLALPDLIRLTLAHNPRLAQSGAAVVTAQGQAVQAGLYPNPVTSISGDEIGDRTGPVILSAQVSQEIVTGGKLQLSRAAGDRAVDRAMLALLTERYSRFTAVRQAYFDVLTLLRRRDILVKLVELADKSVTSTKTLLEAGQVARLDLLQLEVERERYRAEREATAREIPASVRRLAASIGVPALPGKELVGSLEQPVPLYDLNKATAILTQIHPELKSAKVGVDRAQLLLKRAEVEPKPNITLTGGYVYQGQNRSNDGLVGISLPIPIWNRNQGNIQAARGQLGEALAEVGRVEYDLVERLATAFATYASARQRAERYRIDILPRARETYQLSMKAYTGGQFAYLRVLQAQRAVAEADLAYNRALGEQWRAAAEIAGLLLEEDWPACAMPVAAAPK